MQSSHVVRIMQGKEQCVHDFRGCGVERGGEGMNGHLLKGFDGGTYSWMLGRIN
jgi:hypothetical protein